MLLVNSFMILVVSSVIIHAEYDFCSESFSIADLPNGIRFEIKNFLVNGTISRFRGCKNVLPIERNSIYMYLFNRQNKYRGILLNSNSAETIDTTKKTILLVHGWLCNIDNDRIPELKGAYLKRYDANVIAVDWSTISVDLYANSFCNLPQVAKIIANYLCGLRIDFRLIHMVGHSMGGQLAGLIGQEVQRQCYKTIGRITGLDPAGPLYHGLEEDQRLDKTDAQFVDVIHTNAGILGYPELCGTADFYPNCGVYQPGCLFADARPMSKWVKLQSSAIGCSHIRSLDLMISSILGHKLYAQHCGRCHSISSRLRCHFSKYDRKTLMGEDCPIHQARGRYNLVTGSDYPFTSPRILHLLHG